MAIRISPLGEEDLFQFSGTGYDGMPPEARRNMLAASEGRQHRDGHYFEMFTLKDGETVIGFVNLYAQQPDAVSVGLDIREPFRRKGYATRAAEPIAALLTGKGFFCIRTHVRADNEASLRLHEKLGFTCSGRDKTDRGAEVLVFEKRL